jgi:ubiquinone/menaquinone biosynthesis C-methylase UbiE
MSGVSPDDWTNLWNNNIVTSFGATMFSNNYDHEVVDFWQQELQGSYKHVVDLACGNGALVWIANEILNQKSPQTQITGVDIANINPFKSLGKDPDNFPKVNFIGNTPIESLPFEDQSIDIVLSQYGAEYSNLDQTVKDAYRVLIKTGKLCLILHSSDSIVLRGASVAVQCRPVYDQEKLHQLFLDLDQLCNASQETTAVMSQLRSIADIEVFEDRIK